jgi:hypothetical protein
MPATSIVTMDQVYYDPKNNGDCTTEYFVSISP